MPYVEQANRQSSMRDFSPASANSDHVASLKPMPNRDDMNGPNGHETPDSVALYIASLTEELAQIARRNGLDTLSYILEMARLEADQVAKE